MYFAGLAVECCLKAAICKALDWEYLLGAFKTHDLEGLLAYSGLDRELRAEPAIVESFSRLAQRWSGKDSPTEPKDPGSVRYMPPASLDERKTDDFLQVGQRPEDTCDPMVAKQNALAQSVRAIESALQELVRGHEDSRIRLEENEWGHLSIVIGSDRFRGMSEDDRTDLVWDQLRTKLDPKDFGMLSEVMVLDRQEYKEFLDMARWINRSAGGNPDYPADAAL